ncbi:hypothetical protein MLD38_016174 [Melastoma candidum]|uniref:Uncharacterized protein n=1 Tax=Melastoma candidum TaxID=119954 RepID=A0ACB9RHV5_9MYRT|nr:hypothetical protein MLD38_016174 [Melastoma candidum]
MAALVFLILLHHHPPLSPPGKLTLQEKSRLGSTPPSCHNKCNICHPCMAVQVPSTPFQKSRAASSGDAVVDEKPSSSRATTTTSGSISEYIDPSPSNNKPVGWKCSCGNHFYDP